MFNFLTGDGAMIQLILYIHDEADEAGQCMQNGIDQRFQAFPRLICPDLETLKQNLKRPVRYGDLNIFILLADTRDRLEDLHQLHEYFDDKKLLLILPDDEKSTYASGFRLYPRFVTLKSDFEIYLYEVLEKMIEYHNRK